MKSNLFGVNNVCVQNELCWQAQAAILAELEVAETAQELARLLWLIEELMYTDLLRGTGWGRKRNRFREQLEASKTIAQVTNRAYAAKTSYKYLCREE